MVETQKKEPPTTLSRVKLSNSFAAASDVTRLHRALIDSQPENARAQAGNAIAAFYAAAERLKSREAEFALRSRSVAKTGDGGAPDLKINLRSPEHFSALRAFKGAGADIVALSPAHGADLVKAVEKSIATPSLHRST
jgi:hypothetical protein